MCNFFSSCKDMLCLQEMFILRCTRIQEQLELTQGVIIINIKCHVGKQKALSYEQLQQSTWIPAQHYSKHHGLLFSTIATIMDSTAQHYGNHHGFHCIALQQSWILLLSTIAIIDSTAQHYSNHHRFYCSALQQLSQIPLLSTIAIIMDSCLVQQQSSWIHAQHNCNHHGFHC